MTRGHMYKAQPIKLASNVTAVLAVKRHSIRSVVDFSINLPCRGLIKADLVAETHMNLCG